MPYFILILGVILNSFNNFGQSFITNENIQGIASSDINLEVMWNGETDTLYPGSLYMDADLKIINGELGFSQYSWDDQGDIFYKYNYGCEHPSSTLSFY